MMGPDAWQPIEIRPGSAVLIVSALCGVNAGMPQLWPIALRHCAAIGASANSNIARPDPCGYVVGPPTFPLVRLSGDDPSSQKLAIDQDIVARFDPIPAHPGLLLAYVPTYEG